MWLRGQRLSRNTAPTTTTYEIMINIMKSLTDMSLTKSIIHAMTLWYLLPDISPRACLVHSFIIVFVSDLSASDSIFVNVIFVSDLSVGDFIVVYHNSDRAPREVPWL